MRTVRLLCEGATENLWPDLTLLIWVEPEIAFKRAKGRDRFETEGLAFQKRVAAGYAAIAEAEPSIGDGPYLKPITMSRFGMLNWHYLWFREEGNVSRADYARLATQLILGGAKTAVESLVDGLEVQASVELKRPVRLPSRHASAIRPGRAKSM